MSQDQEPLAEKIPCPVPFTQLLDGLLGAMTWFERGYRISCSRAELELCSPHEYVLFRMIARYARRRRAPQTSELATALGIDKGYVTKLSKSLIDEGLVERIRPHHDRRKCVLDLTKYGESVAKGAGEIGFNFWELLLAEFDRAEANEIAYALPLLSRDPDFGPYGWPADE